MDAPLTLIYTANLRGELAILPRLYTLIKRLKPADGRAFVLDVGAACDPSAWHCQVSGGRSVPIVLDGMGYHAANVSAYFAPESRAQIGGLVNMALIDDAHPHEISVGVWAVATPPPATSGCVPLPEFREGEKPRLRIVLADADETRLTDHTLHLERVDARAGQVGVVTLDGTGVLSARVETLSASVLADPTIAGVVEFVISEARYVQKRRAARD